MKKTTREVREKRTKEEEEVDQLLQAAQDDLVLKLSVDSHMSRVDYFGLPDDLQRRFQALKSPSAPITNRSSSSSSTAVVAESDANVNSDQQVDNLLSRFAALKAPSSSSSSPITAVTTAESKIDFQEEEDKDEVEKIIQWAKDAARLDPSPQFDDDDDDDGITDDDDDDDKPKLN
ncbi:hypothetical protein K2173_006763 [Erythroxylum novogranatense]|uniref:Uncharacterized protein n=1 Tax=Erythroxylum novogranatense TaxID=1862640 RepID=A0AAV8SYW3_9ROSI|nr:hypothetical protein K2173_006763 [Erythroxylum novogranatense]